MIMPQRAPVRPTTNPGNPAHPGPGQRNGRQSSLKQNWPAKLAGCHTLEAWEAIAEASSHQTQTQSTSVWTCRHLLSYDDDDGRQATAGVQVTLHDFIGNFKDVHLGEGVSSLQPTLIQKPQTPASYKHGVKVNLVKATWSRHTLSEWPAAGCPIPSALNVRTSWFMQCIAAPLPVSKEGVTDLVKPVAGLCGPQPVQQSHAALLLLALLQPSSSGS